MKRKEICFPFYVPKKFNYLEYSKSINLKGKSREYLYWHYKIIKNKTVRYEKAPPKDIESTPKGVDSMGITLNEWFIICSILTSVDTRMIALDEGIEKIYKLCNNIPYIDINKILKTYYDIIDQKLNMF